MRLAWLTEISVHDLGHLTLDPTALEDCVTHFESEEPCYECGPV